MHQYLYENGTSKPIAAEDGESHAIPQLDAWRKYLDKYGSLGYTIGITKEVFVKTLKTAISIDKDLFKKVENLCEKIKISRSQFFSQAVEYFITKSENLEIIQKINSSYADPNSGENEKLLKLRKAKYKKAIVDKW